MSTNETAGSQVRIDVDGNYRVAVFSFGTGAPRKLEGFLAESIREAFNGAQGARIALFPGVLPSGRAHWPPRDLIVNELAANGVSGLFESFDEARRRAYFAYEAGRGLLPVEIRQQFTTSKDATLEKVEALVAECRPGGERTVRVGGVPIGLLVCGENNVLANKQSERNGVYVRHNVPGSVFSHAPIIFNGAHDNMGNWGKLNRRFEYLSAKKRWAFYATNCVLEGSWGRSSIRAYYDGNLVGDSSRVKDRWRGMCRLLESDATEGGWVALALDVPGKKLARAAW